MSKPIVCVVRCHSYKYAEWDSAGHKTGLNEVRADAQRNTWYKHFGKYQDQLDIRFFYGQGAHRDPNPDEVFLDCLDGYYDLPEKIKAMFQWVLDNGNPYALKLDDDIYFRASNFLKNFQPHDYCGYELEAAIGKYASGAAYCVSRKAMQLVVDAPWQTGFNSAEDQWTGEVLKRNGISLIHDPRYLCCHCPDCFKKYGLDNLITIHTRSPEQMHELHTKLAG